MSEQKIKRALISVYDKTGIVDFAKALVDEFGVEIISTGGTARLLSENSIPVTLVEEVTDFPEMMDGRVKTLHPKIHAGILADRDNPEHMRQLKQQGIDPIDMVVVNLYPFDETVADPDCTLEQAIEMIDIGGPCMLRASAKNHKHVLVVYDAEAYDETLVVLSSSDSNPADLCELRLRYAAGAFEATTCYDAMVARWLGQRDSLEAWPWLECLPMSNWGAMRYGENPHQMAELLAHIDGTPDGHDLTIAEVASDGDEQRRMSFNNYADAHAALAVCAELSRAHNLQCLSSEGGAERGVSGICSTGSEAAEPPSGVAPASSRWASVEGDEVSERNLPHLETTGRSYFITFRTKDQTLSPRARTVALEACKHWHGSMLTLHAVVIMPDHVHLLITPFDTESGGSLALGQVIHSIKSFSANQINKLEGWTGPLWQDERWDRIMRTEKEFIETWEYIETNPDRANLEANYPWFWGTQTEFQERGLYLGRDTSSTQDIKEKDHRLEAGATPELDPKKKPDHRHRAVHAHQKPSRHCCVFVKHTNACGVGVGDDPLAAYAQAYLGDPNAAMGGILACDLAVDVAFAETVMDTFARWGKGAGAGGFFVEVWIAPSFDDKAIDVIRGAKKWGERVRLLATGDMAIAPNEGELEYKSIAGGMLVQTRDTVGLNEDQWKVVSKRSPTDAEMTDLRLAWLVCKHTKSNAITICKDNMLIGNGAGQMSRVMSCRIATWLAKENGHADKLPGAAAASDAFFPFPDGPTILIDAGVTAIIQPGGSKRDEDTIAACNERDVALILTGTRHFKH